MKLTRYVTHYTLHEKNNWSTLMRYFVTRYRQRWLLAGGWQSTGSSWCLGLSLLTNQRLYFWLRVFIQLYNNAITGFVITCNKDELLSVGETVNGYFNNSVTIKYTVTLLSQWSWFNFTVFVATEVVVLFLGKIQQICPLDWNSSEKSVTDTVSSDNGVMSCFHSLLFDFAHK